MYRLYVVAFTEGMKLAAYMNVFTSMGFTRETEL